MNDDELYMKEALKEAKKAEAIDEVPIGCVIVRDHVIIARAHNLRESKQEATAHAEILAIQKACKKVGSWRLEDCTLYVTLEPCAMCSGATLLSRLDRVVYGASDVKGGCVDTCMKMYETQGFNHYPAWQGGTLKQECGDIISSFFRKKRNQAKARSNS